MIRGEWRAAAEIWRGFGCPFELALALSAGDSASQIEALRILEQLGNDYVRDSPLNRLRDIDGGSIWETPLVGFVDGDDPLFGLLKQVAAASVGATIGLRP